MTNQRRKLASHLLAVNLAGLATGIAFYLVSGVLAGFAGFVAGLLAAAFLVKKKSSKRRDAGVFQDLKQSRNTP